MAEEWAYEEASDEEKLQIAQRFLLASPPGQIHEVLRDVAKLVPARVLPDAALRGALHAYNVKNCVPVDVPDADYKILICEEGEVDAAHYVDPIGNRVLGFDHIKQQIVPDDVAEIPEDRWNCRCVHCGHEAGGEFVHGAYQSAQLLGRTLEIAVGGDLTANPSKVEGNMQLHVHYFENGNLQLQNSKDIEEEITVQRPGGLGDAILRVMKEAEDDLQTNLEDMYINMSEETFKEMRRVMPVRFCKLTMLVS
ncbi:F-actin-capping protein subunit alpha [Phytophthora cactorum]|nr:F-actin-capping protein subunit alpha [Phytophthora cactorum]